MDTELSSKNLEKKLVKNLKSGNSNAQSDFYKQYSSVLFAICIRYLGNTMEAEDALIEGIMKIFKNIGKFDGTGSFEGWCKKVMVNHSLSKIRQQKIISVELSEVEYELQNTETPDDNIAAEELLALLVELPLGYRTVFNLYAIEGYNHSEIAEKLGISIGTSKSQLNRARNFLQKRINEINFSIK